MKWLVIARNNNTGKNYPLWFETEFQAKNFVFPYFGHEVLQIIYVAEGKQYQSLTMQLTSRPSGSGGLRIVDGLLRNVTIRSYPIDKCIGCSVSSSCCVVPPRFARGTLRGVDGLPRHVSIGSFYSDIYFLCFS